MTTNNNINNYAMFEGFIQSKVLKASEENQERDSETVIHLAALLNNLSQTVAQVKSDGSSSGSVSSAGSNIPSSQQIADSLAALAAMMAALQSTINKSTDAQYTAALKIQLAQLEQAVKFLTDLQNFINNFPKSQEQFQDWINQQSPQFQSWWNHTVSRFNPGTGDAWNQPDPLISEITQAITEYVSEKFGITLHLGSNYGSLNDLLNDAMAQVKTGLAKALDSYAKKIANQLSGINNPIVQAILQMLQHGRRITSKDLENLQNLLNQILEVLSEMANASAQNGSEAGPSNSMVISMLSLMSGVMNQLEGTVAQASTDKQKADALIAQAMIKQAQASLEKAQKQEADIEAQKAAQKSLSLFMKIIEAVVAVVISAVACAFGQIQIAVITMTMMIMQESGALDKISSAIADSLVKDGLSPENAKIVADVITTVLVIVVSCAASYASSLSSVAKTAVSRAAGASESAVETAANTTEQAAQEATDAAIANSVENLARVANPESLMQKASQLLSKLNIFSQFSPQVNMVIFTATQSMMQTNLIADATVAALTAEHKDAKTIAQAQMIAQIVGSVVLSLVSAGSMAAMMSSTDALGAVGTNGSNIMKMLENLGSSIRNAVPANVLTGINTGMQYGGWALQSAAELGLGITYTKQANATEALGQDQAAVAFYNSLADVTNAGMASTQKNTASAMKAHQEIDKTVRDTMLAGQAEFSRLFSQAV